MGERPVEDVTRAQRVRDPDGRYVHGAPASGLAHTMGRPPRLTADQPTPWSLRNRRASVGVAAGCVPGGRKSSEQTATSIDASSSSVPAFQLPPSRTVLRPAARAARAVAVANSMWWPSNSTMSQAATSASRSSGGVSRCAVALVEATARSPLDSVTRMDDTAGGSAESAARSDTVTPSPQVRRYSDPQRMGTDRGEQRGRAAQMAEGHGRVRGRTARGHDLLTSRQFLVGARHMVDELNDIQRAQADEQTLRSFPRRHRRLVD